MLLDINTPGQFIMVAFCILFGIGLIYVIIYFRNDGKRYEEEFARNEEKKRLAKLPQNIYAQEILSTTINLDKYKSNACYPYIKLANPQNCFFSVVPDFDSFEIKEGYSEKYFHNYLIKEFGDNFIHKGTVQIDYFFPDYIYYDSENKVNIVIEIDEPYSVSDAQPIHCFDADISYSLKPEINDQNSTKDSILSKKGWTVIRFSEEQIVFHTALCINLISKVIHYWNRNYKVSKEILDTEFPSVMRWTSEFATTLSKIKSRNLIFEHIASLNSHALLSESRCFPISIFDKKFIYGVEHSIVLDIPSFNNILSNRTEVNLEMKDNFVEFYIESITLRANEIKFLLLNLNSKLKVDKILLDNSQTLLEFPKGAFLTHRVLEQILINLQIVVSYRKENNLFALIKTGVKYKGKLIVMERENLEELTIDPATIEPV